MVEFIRTLAYPKVFALGHGTPSWTRLEPQSVTGDPRPGLEARVHDPLWLLCRQWQLGEFEGDDAGAPLGVELSVRSRALTRWQAGRWDIPDQQQKPILPLASNELLEPVVEDEPGAVDAVGLRARADGGGVFLTMLAESGFGELREAVVAHAGVEDAPAGDRHDRSWPNLIRLLAGRAVDGRRLADALDGATAHPHGLPTWLAVADGVAAERLGELARAWRSWYREVDPEPDPDSDAWVGDRLEYRFSVAGRVGAGEVVLRAPEFVGGELDWHTFDIDIAARDFGTPDDAGDQAVQTRLATPLRFAGMPADRLWEFEDAAVNLGALQVEPHDLARLLLVEFALSYSNDWLVVPVDVPFGSLATIEWLTYTNTFGERFRVRPPRATRTRDRWRMFRVTDADGEAELDALLVPPAVVAFDQGAAYEDVLFLRDENANLVWAVERTVSAPSGDVRARADEQTQPQPPVHGDAEAELDYRVMNGVPDHWIPYLPRTSGYQQIELVQGRMRRFDQRPGDPPIPADGLLVAPVGRLLTERGSDLLADAEVPREGVRVQRVPVLAQRVDGSYRRWTARRVRVGRGEGRSGLAFDGAYPRRPTS